MVGEHAVDAPAVGYRHWDVRPLVVMALALAVNATVALRGFLYADDYRGHSLGARYGWSTEWLIEWHRSHFSPLDRAHFTVFVQIAPLEHWFAVLVMSLELAAALVLTWLVASRLLERRWALLALVAFGLSPLLVATNAWLIQAISLYGVLVGTNLAALALLLYLESPRRRWLAMGALGWLLGALTWETWLVGPPALALLAVFWLARGTPRERVLWAWSAGRSFWVMTMVMIGSYLLVWKLGGYGTKGAMPSVDALLTAVWKSLYALVLPASVGGPWTWFAPENAYSPIGATPASLVALVALAFGIAITYAFQRDRLRTIQGLVLLVIPVALSALMAAVGRLDAFPASIPLEPRYLAPALPFMAIGLAVLAQVALTGWQRSGRRRVSLLAGAVVLIGVGWAVTITRFVDIWSLNPGQEYVANARASLPRVHEVSGIFDTEVPAGVMSRWFWPYNTTKELLRPIIPEPDTRFGAAGSQSMYDSSGALVPARFYPLTSASLDGCVPLAVGSRTTIVLPHLQIHLANLTVRVEVRATEDVVIGYSTDPTGSDPTIISGPPAEGTLAIPAGTGARFGLLQPYGIDAVNLTLHEGSACVASLDVGQPAP